MNVDYWSIGATTRTAWPVTNLELATDIALDWMPTRPACTAPAVVDLLDEILEQDTPNNCWLANPAVAGFERQWRGVTSFMIGVPFCIKVIRQLGYTWWAPVGCFRHNLHTNKPFYWWSPAFPISRCEVRHDSVNPSRLYPDYIAAKRDPAGNYRIAYFEAKGTVNALQNCVLCPTHWHQQVRSAQLYNNGVYVPASQNVVVATRLRPDAVYPSTRRIQVRAWNNNDPELLAPFDLVSEVVRVHYVGVCLRLGLERTAQALAMAPAFHGDGLEARRWRTALGKRMPQLEDSSNVSREETEERPVTNSQYPTVHFARGRENLGCGPYAIRAGLSFMASYLVDSLINGQTETVRTIMHDLPGKLRGFQKEIAEDERRYLRSDGVYSELVGE